MIKHIKSHVYNKYELFFFYNYNWSSQFPQNQIEQV